MLRGTFQYSLAVARGPEGLLLLGGFSQNLLFITKGLEGPFVFGCSFWVLDVVVKGPEGPHLLGGTTPDLIPALTGPEGPRTSVSCQKLWGARTGARDVCRAPYYYEVGCVQWDLCWGVGSILVPFVRFRIFLPGPSNTEQTSATAPPRQFPLLNPGGGLT